MDIDILLIDKPAVANEIKAKSYIDELISELAEQAMAILRISSAMPEMVAFWPRELSDYYAVRDFLRT